MTIVAIANQKGGVGKSTSTCNLGHGAARAGWKTLIIDFDPQGHDAVSFKLKKGPGLYNLIYGEDPASQILQARDNLDLIPSDKRTELAGRYLTTLSFREQVVKDILHRASRPYDLVLLDLAPSLGILHVAALWSADFVIIPTRLDHLAMDGVNEILLSIQEIQRLGGAIVDYAILPTFYELRTRETRLQYRTLVELFKGHVWAPIPEDTKVRESVAFGQTLWEYAPTCRAMIGYDGHPCGYQVALKKMMEVLHA